MPVIPSPAIILVTVRSESKGEPLKELFKEYGDKFHLVVVPDVTALDAYDDAVKGVAGVVHVSTPGPQVSVTDVDGKTEVRRFVLTGSIITCLEPKEGEYTYTEADWFDTALHIVKAQGAKAPPHLIYGASKILQERAVFDFVEKKKDRISFDVVALLPTLVLGVSEERSNGVALATHSSYAPQPPVNTFVDITSPPPGSIGWMHQAFNNPDGKNWDGVVQAADVIVDVRDVAELHARALSTEKAGGERYILTGNLFHWQDAWDALNIEPKLPGAPVGSPGAGKRVHHRLQYSNKKSKETFGFEYRSNEETIRDSWAEFLKRGWIESIKA
ncbi:methylglyoxal reductase (NADPH-dependent) gre2 [Tulasnella sp. 408]|nr:methylglyoxal reductase (NADPH-dependent) gre2 [Tulasnella sp. 408]